MRRTIALVAGSVLVVALLPAGTASARPSGDLGPSAAERAFLFGRLDDVGWHGQRLPGSGSPPGIGPRGRCRIERAF